VRLSGAAAVTSEAAVVVGSTAAAVPDRESRVCLQAAERSQVGAGADAHGGGIPL
jgi:hypothetical protein